MAEYILIYNNLLRCRVRPDWARPPSAGRVVGATANGFMAQHSDLRVLPVLHHYTSDANEGPVQPIAEPMEQLRQKRILLLKHACNLPPRNESGLWQNGTFDCLCNFWLFSLSVHNISNKVAFYFSCLLGFCIFCSRQ